MPSETALLWDVLPKHVKRPSLHSDPFWGEYEKENCRISVHLAILRRSYLDLILNLEKTVESRFSVDRRTPYDCVAVGDVVLLKQVSGPILGIARAANVWFFELNDKQFKSIQKNFAEDLRIEDPHMWARIKKSSYATLIRLDNVRRINPIAFPKRDQRAWIVFSPKCD